MNFDHLHYIKYVLEYQSIAVAADKLFVSSSAISQAITGLEKELKMKLFDRSRQGTLPTEDGKWMLPKLMELYQKTLDVKQEARDRQSELNGKLTVATVPGVFMTLLPKIFTQFKREHPKVHCQIIESENPKVMERVIKKEVDLGFIAMTNEIKEKSEILHIQPLPVSSNYYLIVNEKSPFASFEELSIHHLQNTPFIFYGDEFFINLLHEFSTFEPQILFSSYNSEVIKKSVIEGLGVSILSDLMLKEDPYIVSGQLKAIKLTDYPFNMVVTYSLIYRTDCPNKKIIESLLKLMK